MSHFRRENGFVWDFFRERLFQKYHSTISSLELFHCSPKFATSLPLINNTDSNAKATHAKLLPQLAGKLFKNNNKVFFAFHINLMCVCPSACSTKQKKKRIQILVFFLLLYYYFLSSCLSQREHDFEAFKRGRDQLETETGKMNFKSWGIVSVLFRENILRRRRVNADDLRAENFTRENFEWGSDDQLLLWSCSLACSYVSSNKLYVNNFIPMLCSTDSTKN